MKANIGINDISKERLAGTFLFILVVCAVVSIATDAMVYRIGGDLSSYLSNPLSAGATAPPFELESLAGKTVSLDQFEGSPVLLMFWGSS